MGNQFGGVRFARMSSGTWCLVRDLGLVKGGKGLKCFETIATFSFRALRASAAAGARTALKACGELMRGHPARSFRTQQRRMQDIQ